MADVKLVTVKMTRNKHGSPDGIRVQHYEKGETYDVPSDLAKLFVETDKVADYAEKAEKPVKNKAEKVAKNKDDGEE